VTKTAVDPRLCYQVSVARLTVVEASTMNASDPARTTGEGCVTLFVPLLRAVRSVKYLSACHIYVVLSLELSRIPCVSN
jgi:hypothetical protein